MAYEHTKCALHMYQEIGSCMYYIFCSLIYCERHEKFLLHFFIAKILFVLNLTKIERRKLESSLRIALWVKSKMAATMAG